MSDNKKQYPWGNTILQDVETIKSIINDNRTGNWRTDFWDSSCVEGWLMEIIERELRRKLQQENPPEIDITEKEKLENERDKFHDQAEHLYKWFCYYQDKSKELESNMSKSTLPDFPSEELPLTS